nr:reverse transcriptase domain-containing protein [Tanacetum cinerariifolium]
MIESHVLWAHRTMIKSSNGETPFSLTYGTEARKRESKPQFRKQGIKPKWKDITTPEFEAPAFVQKTLSTGIMKQAMRKSEASSDLSGKDRTKSQKHWEKKHTSLETAMDTPFREHGTSATLKSVTYMKCKHPFARKAKRKKKTLGFLFVCNIFKFLMNEKVKLSYL